MSNHDQVVRDALTYTDEHAKLDEIEAAGQRLSAAGPAAVQAARTELNDDLVDYHSAKLDPFTRR